MIQIHEGGGGNEQEKEKITWDYKNIQNLIYLLLYQDGVIRRQQMEDSMRRGSE